MTTEILILGEIGLDTVAADVLREIAEAPDEIRVMLDSPGGEVMQAISICNALRNHPYNVVVHIIGSAFSGGSIIAMAGDEILIDPNAAMMIHRAWVQMEGSAKELATTAALLEKSDKRLIRIYAERSGLDAETIAKLMQRETWMDAEEAVRYGFADRIADAPARVAALACKPRGAAKLFNNLVRSRMTKGHTRGQALRIVAKKNPRLHALMLLETNRGKDQRALNDVRERGGLKAKPVKRTKATRRTRRSVRR